MTQATFTIPALEFTPDFFGQIQPFLQGTDIEVFVQVRQKAKRGRKNGKTPLPPLPLNIPAQPSTSGIAITVPEPFVKKYPQQPTPEEGLKILAAFAHHPNRHPAHDLEAQVLHRKNNPPDEKRVLQIIREMDVQEPIDELLALLTP